MNSTIQPGHIQTLPVYDQHEYGYLLGSEEFTIFLPSRGIAKSDLDQEAYKVFVFYNENGQLEATTHLPVIELGQVDVFRVKNVNSMGAFIDIGTARDILLPNKEMKEPLEAGFTILAGLLDDPIGARLYLTQKINGFFPNTDIPFERGDEVELLIGEKIEVGRRALVNRQYMAALFRAEMTFNVKLGDRVKGYIRKIEGKSILVSMQREGMLLLEDAQKKILGYLEANNGYVRLNDDTDPDEIKRRLHMSKKTFKRAAGMLYRDGKVILTKFGIKINQSGELPSAEELAKWAPKEEKIEREMPANRAPRRDSRPQRRDDYQRNTRRNEDQNTPRSPRRFDKPNTSGAPSGPKRYGGEGQAKPYRDRNTSAPQQPFSDREKKVLKELKGPNSKKPKQD
jgi:predicted RNA-binding protein (virulence factor B family)